MAEPGHTFNASRAFLRARCAIIKIDVTSDLRAVKDVHIHYGKGSVESRIRSCASKGSEAGLHRNRGICFRFAFTT